MITFPAAQLAAMVHACATRDVRVYFHDVRVQRDERGAFLIATDGNILAVRRVGDGGAPFDAAIPAASSKTIGKRGDVSVDTKTATMTCGPVTLTLETDLAEIRHYPDWRRVVPSRVSVTPEGGTAFFCPKRVMRAAKVLEPDLVGLSPDVRNSSMLLHHGETNRSAGVLSVGYGWSSFVVIMPLVRPVGEALNQWEKPYWA